MALLWCHNDVFGLHDRTKEDDFRYPSGGESDVHADTDRDTATEDEATTTKTGDVTCVTAGACTACDKVFI